MQWAALVELMPLLMFFAAIYAAVTYDVFQSDRQPSKTATWGIWTAI